MPQTDHSCSSADAKAEVEMQPNEVVGRHPVDAGNALALATLSPARRTRLDRDPKRPARRKGALAHTVQIRRHPCYK